MIKQSSVPLQPVTQGEKSAPFLKGVRANTPKNRDKGGWDETHLDHCSQLVNLHAGGRT